MRNLFQRINDWSFGLKVAAALLLIGIVPVAVVSFVLSNNAATALSASTYSSLDAVGSLKANALSAFMKERLGDIAILSERYQLAGSPDGTLGVEAMSAHKSDRSSPEFQAAYTSALAAMDSANKAYAGAYTDINLFDTRGDIMAQSNRQQADAGVEANVADEEYFIQGLKGAYNSGIIDYKRTGEQTLILSRPLKNPSGRTVGVIMLELNLTSIDNILSDRTGLGETGETLLVNQDKLLLNQARFVETPTRLAQKVDTYSVQQALAGKSGTDVYKDYRGVSVLGTYRPIQEYGWVIVSKLDESEALASANQARLIGVISVAVAALAAAGLAFALSRLLTRQVGELDRLFRAARVGDFDARAQVFSRDEIGKAADGLNALLDNLVGLMRGNAVRMESIIQSASDSVVTVDEQQNIVFVNPAAEQMFGVKSSEVVGTHLSRFIPQRFQGAHGKHLRSYGETGETNRAMGKGNLQVSAVRANGEEFPQVDANISQVEAAGQKLFTVILRDVTARQVAEAQMASQNAALAAALEDLRRVAAEVESTTTRVTEASGTMSSVVKLMVDQAASSAQVAEEAASSATEGGRAVDETIAAMGRIREGTQETARRVKRLGEVSQEISEIVRLIEDLTDRTTVLALNASIQAASAGEAGRGFAVVAEEVQRLAERSAGATRQIEELVKNIQVDTNEVVVGIEDATREVVEGSHLAQQAGERMGELNNRITDLSSLIQHIATNTAHQTTESLATVSDLSQSLLTTVAGFGAGQPGNGNGGMPQSTDSSRQ